MKKIVTALLVIAALSVASAAMALDLARHTPSFAPNRHPFDTQSVQALIGCDDNVEGNAYFQATDDRLGNVFSFGTGKLLSRVQFVHYGFGFAGPYNYDIELWDPISCTFIAAKNGLVAADASGANTVTENVNLCPANLFATGDAAGEEHSADGDHCG